MLRSQSSLPVSASRAIGGAVVVDEVELAADEDRRELEQRPLGVAPELAERRLDPLGRQVAGAGRVEPEDRPVDGLRLRLRRLLRHEGRRSGCGRRRGASAARRRARRRRPRRAPRRRSAPIARPRRHAPMPAAASGAEQERFPASAAQLAPRRRARPALSSSAAAARRSDSVDDAVDQPLDACLTAATTTPPTTGTRRLRPHRVDHLGAATVRGQLDRPDVVAHRQPGEQLVGEAAGRLVGDDFLAQRRPDRGQLRGSRRPRSAPARPPARARTCAAA